MPNESWKVYVGDENKGLLTPFRILHLVQDLISDKENRVIQITLISNSGNLFSETRYKNINEIRTAIMNSTYENSLSHSERVVFNALDTLDDKLAWNMYLSLSQFIDKFLF